MVYAFFCQSVASTPCRLLYSAVYGDDMQSAVSENTPLDQLRETRKEQLMQVACRVQSEYGFRMAAKVQIPRGYIKEETSGLSQGEKGLFRLSPGDPFTAAKTVLWQVCDGCGFVMICDSDENRITADNVLNIIIKLIQEHILSLEQKIAEIMLKGEKLSAILHVFLPNGQLLLINHKLMKQLERNLDNILSVKM